MPTPTAAGFAGRVARDLPPIRPQRQKRDLTDAQLAWCREEIPHFKAAEAQARAMQEAREANRKEMAA